MKNAAIIALIVFSFLAATFAFITYRNYIEKCDISGGFIGRPTKACSCFGVKIPIKTDPKIRDGFIQNYCIGIQKTTFKR